MDVMLNSNKLYIMKKNIYQLGILLMVATIMSSCSDYLDKNPTNSLSQETFYQSKSDIDMALTSCYSILKDHEYTTSIAFLDCLADNGYNKDDYWSSMTISQGPITPTTGGIGAVYSKSYSRIARYNIFLKALSEYTDTDISEEEKIEYEAEVRMLRGMAYLELYKYYGSVPLVLEPLTYENQDQPKVDETEIFSQVISDLDFAIEHLPDVSYRDNNGHLVKTSAQVAKARALIYTAYTEDGTAKPEVMEQVKQITSEIINTGYYAIGPSYRGLFCDDLGEQTDNPEYIFSVKFVGPHSNALSYWDGTPFVVYCQWAGWGECAPLQNFVEEYEFIDGTAFSEDNPLYDKNDVFKNRDPRMAKTFCSGTITFENGYTYTIQAASPTNYTYYKNVTGSNALDPNSNNLGSDWPAMRYAEVLLMYAEAANEIDGPTQEVHNAINQIRSRADIQMPNLPSNLTKDQMRQAIRKERRIELAFEGFRYDDVKRWRIAEERLNMSQVEGVASRSFEKKNYHWPIPQSEIDKSNGVLVQNPDY